MKRLLLLILLIPSLSFAQTVIWDKPTTNEGWAEDVKEESLHYKYYEQLKEMKESLIAKLPQPQDDLYWLLRYPDAKRKELEIDGYKPVEVEEILKQDINYYRWKVSKIEQSIERIEKEIYLRDIGFVDREPKGTTYYIDFECGTPGDGTTATCNGDADDSYDQLEDFTEVARSAGDKAIVRRGGDETVSSNCDFTSDGTVSNPIIVEADYGDAWSDETTAGETATLTDCSVTVTFAGDISGDIAAGDWIYETNDDNKDFSYEVKAVSGGSNEVVTLYLPYKGGNAGAGKTIEVMPDNPI